MSRRNQDDPRLEVVYVDTLAQVQIGLQLSVIIRVRQRDYAPLLFERQREIHRSGVLWCFIVQRMAWSKMTEEG